MNTSAKGAKQERKSRKILEAEGYACMRAGGSLGIWDVFGVRAKDAVLLQCKTRDWPGSVEMETLKNFVCPRNFRKIVHRWRDGSLVPDVKEID